MGEPRFKLPFPRSSIGWWAARCAVEADKRVESIALAVRRKGYLTRDQFLVMAEWKTPRSRRRCAYTNFLRVVSSDAAVSMRTLDKALWQYSKERQT